MLILLSFKPNVNCSSNRPLQLSDRGRIFCDISFGPCDPSLLTFCSPIVGGFFISKQRNRTHFFPSWQQLVLENVRREISKEKSNQLQAAFRCRRTSWTPSPMNRDEKLQLGARNYLFRCTAESRYAVKDEGKYDGDEARRHKNQIRLAAGREAGRIWAQLARDAQV